MIAILEDPLVRHRASPVSVEDYHRLGEFNQQGRRTELVRGAILEKMPKSPLHSFVVHKLVELLRPQVTADFWLRQEQPLTLADSEPEPDISVVQGQPVDYLATHPSSASLVIEVAVTNPALDREMALVYAEAGVNEYWIVRPQERRVEVYRSPNAGRYGKPEIHGPTGDIRSESLPVIEVSLEDLWA